jgi:DNA-binding transcriptional MerR regulator
MRITEAARRLEISADWLRRLERVGRLPTPTRDYNGHRRYSAEDLDAIRAVLLVPASRSGPEPTAKETDRGGTR